jgi:hypothetical protein
MHVEEGRRIEEIALEIAEDNNDAQTARESLAEADGGRLVHGEALRKRLQGIES